jgi:DNA-binding GntR family transcriptional regulator
MQAHQLLIRHQFRIMLVPERQDKTPAEHREILTSREPHDAAGAESAMRHPIAQLRRSVQQAD